MRKVKCPDCGKDLEVVEQGLYCAKVTCENCQQCWFGLVENVAKENFQIKGEYTTPLGENPTTLEAE